ncbi:hypothetical protein [Subtercola boreus]|nr:hypothetical protein [Subtercola boreus]
MTKESDGRRRLILGAVSALNLGVTIYRAEKRGRTELVRRELCLRALVSDLARANHSRLCLERDDTLVSRDRQHLIDATRKTGTDGVLSYRHESAVSEPLLALPDSLAWAWAKGGDWRRRCPQDAVRVADL